VPIITAADRGDANIRGEEHGATVSLILDESEPGQGPRLHRHPYDETWVVQEGQITLQLGDEQFQAGPGDIAIVPRGVPHKFTNTGTGRSKLVCIHASPRFVGEWLE
jgi:mannose-6-phosphate isomerase-like protein (cupin superfamily)